MRIFYIFYVICFSVFINFCNSNKEQDSSFSIVANDVKSLEENKYLLKIPENPQGLIILFPKYGSDLQTTDFETEIDEKFYDEGYATIIIDYDSEFFLSEDGFFSIYELINEVISKNKIPSNKIVVGGFSIGGTIALSYSIWIKKLDMTTNIPHSIFVGDSPVDLEALYNNKNIIIKRNFNDRSVNESKFIINYLEDNLGNPKTNINEYYKFSPFVNSNIEESNISYLEGYHILFYSENDINWYKETIGYEYEDLNSFQIEKLYSELKKRSNKKVDYIKTKNKGFIGTTKHPHSWTIIDENKLFDWMSNTY